MLWLLLGLIAAGIVVVVVGLRRIRQRYRNLFADAHFEEVHARFVRTIEAIDVAVRRPTRPMPRRRSSRRLSWPSRSRQV
jgi:hypothetical protein